MIDFILQHFLNYFSIGVFFAIAYGFIFEIFPVKSKSSLGTMLGIFVGFLFITLIWPLAAFILMLRLVDKKNLK